MTVMLVVVVVAMVLQKNGHGVRVTVIQVINHDRVVYSPSLPLLQLQV
jgi:hypothetical protein